MYALCADAWFHAAKRKVIFFRFSNINLGGVKKRMNCVLEWLFSLLELAIFYALFSNQ